MEKVTIAKKIRSAIRASQRRMNGTAQGHVDAMDCLQARLGDLLEEMDQDLKRVQNWKINCPKHGMTPVINLDNGIGCEKCYK